MRATATALVASLGLVLGLSPGCDKPAKDHVSLDFNQFGNELSNRENKMFESPKVSASMNDLMTSIGTNAAVTSAAGELFGRIAADPRVASAGQTVLGQVTSSPEIQQFVMAVMAENPGISPDKLGEIVGNKFQAIANSPDVQPGLQTAFNDMFARLHPQSRITGAFNRVGAQLDAYMQQPDRVAKWSDRLRALNGGTEPDQATATRLYIDHAWSTDRMEAFALKVFANPTVRSETATAVADLLKDPAIENPLRESIAEVVSDKTLQGDAAELMIMMTRTPVPSKDVAAKVHEMLTAPVVTTNVDKIVALLFDDPKVRASLAVHWDKIVADPQVKTDFDELLDKW